jgi:hypothetical protein
MRTLAILCATLFLPAFAAAQADTSVVPRELATALVSTADYSSSRARIVVGTLPTPEMAGMLPRGGRVLGGLVHEDRRGNANRFTGIVSFRESPDSVATLVEQWMTQLGLEPPNMSSSMGWRGGFMPAATMGVGRERPLMFCGDSASVTAIVTEYAAGSLLRLTTQTSLRNTICEARSVRVTGMISDRPDRIELPSLRAPKGSVGGPTGAGGGGARQGSSAQYTARETVAELLAHFASQLQEQGWTLGKRIGDDDIGVLTARKVEKGEAQFLTLTDFLSGPRQHELELSVLAPSRRP